jgi:hypothetical protein
MKAKTIIGLALLAVGLFWPQIQERIPDFTIPSKPTLEIVEPSEEIKEKVSSIAELVTDKEDRMDLAVFNMIFAKRVLNYEAEAQDVQDIYVEAAKILFDKSLKGKYNGYGESIQDLLKDSMGDENHTLSQSEKDSLSEDFNGLAYVLSRN